MRLERLIYADSLQKPGVIAEDEFPGCRQTFTDTGYRIEVLGRFKFCDESAASASLTGLRSVRIEASVVWSEVPGGSYRQFGSGAASLRCRGEREDGDATGYFVGLTSSGAWGINRYRDGRQMILAEGRDATVDPAQGDVQRLRLDCVQLTNGDVQLIFYVEGNEVASFTDVSSVPPGVIGFSADSLTTKPFAVTFRDLRVYGPV